jgi:hypothetical protein
LKRSPRDVLSAKALRALAHFLAEKTDDAYSRERYGRSWKACALLLLKRGFDEREVEAVLRSKWMRWAGDRSRKAAHRHYTSTDLARYLDTTRHQPVVPGCLEVGVLVQQTPVLFGGES